MKAIQDKASSVPAISSHSTDGTEVTDKKRSGFVSFIRRSPLVGADIVIDRSGSLGRMIFKVEIPA